MARRFFAGACAFAGFLFLALASNAAVAEGAAGGDPFAPPPTTMTAPPPAPAVPLPPPPVLTHVAMPSPPPSFCSEIDRGRFLADVFNPAVNASNANVETANAHLDELNRAVATAPNAATTNAAHKAFSDYQPIASQAYHYSLDVLGLRPAIMSTPVASCGPPAPPPTTMAAATPPPTQMRRDDPPPRAMRRDDPPPTAYQAPAPRAFSGPKRTVAIGVIQASGGFDKSEDWAPGGALSAMLSTSLSGGGRVIVVERNELGQVLTEAQLRAAHVTGGSSDLPIKMIPAQYIVVGSVTEFGAPNQGGGFSIGGSGEGGFGGALGIRKETGKVAIDLRVLNARTGEIVNAFTVSKTVTHTAVSITTDYRGVSMGGDSFKKTPLGEACRQALMEAADRIADAVAGAGWEAKVVDADGEEAFVNAGAEAGLAPGDRLRVERLGRVLTDPDTGQILSEHHETVGELVIESAEPKVARGRFNPSGPGMVPQRGDLAIYEGGPS
jgi:curli biogenesis system outer membrane secretion channel CsgG